MLACRNTAVSCTFFCCLQSLPLTFEHISPISVSVWMRVAGWPFQLSLTCTCVWLCVSAARAPSSVVAVFAVYSAFCHLYAGLPVLLLGVLAAVHPNMALLPTGITSVRSASTRSRATVWPWGKTQHSNRRKLPGPGGWTPPDDHLVRISGCFHSTSLWGKSFQSQEPTWTWLSLSLFFCAAWYQRSSLKRRKMTCWTLNRE